MDLLIISGFLGAGKTSLLLPLAKGLCDAGRKLAIVENEIGETGIDDIILREANLPVRELYSGCICCSLRVNLVTTLMEIEQEYAPDLVIVEPSGVAGPRQVVSALQGYDGKIDRTLVLTLLDAERLPKLETILLPFITNGIEAADLLVLNKIDAVEPAALAKLSESILAIRPEANLLGASAVTGENMDVIEQWLAEALSAPPSSPVPRPAAKGDEADARPAGAIAFSHSGELRLSTAKKSGEGLTEQLQTAMDVFRESLRQGGCSLVGHIKAIAKESGGGFVFLSATDFDSPLRIQGRLAFAPVRVELTLNAIVFDIERALVKELFSRAFLSLVG